jgi:hypothetical protein
LRSQCDCRARFDRRGGTRVRDAACACNDLSSGRTCKRHTRAQRQRCGQRRAARSLALSVRVLRHDDPSLGGMTPIESVDAIHGRVLLHLSTICVRKLTTVVSAAPSLNGVCGHGSTDIDLSRASQVCRDPQYSATRCAVNRPRCDSASPGGRTSAAPGAASLDLEPHLPVVTSSRATLRAAKRAKSLDHPWSSC